MWKIFRSGGSQKEKSRVLSSKPAYQSPVARFFMIGPGNVGKTTIIKQMQKLCQTEPMTYRQYNDDWSAIVDDALSEENRSLFVDKIHQNTLAAASYLLEELQKLRPLSQEEKELYDEIDEPATIHTRHVRLTQPSAELIIDLLANKVYDSIDASRLPHNTEYFLNAAKLKEICQPDYIPSEDDIIRARNPTSGEREYNFLIVPTTPHGAHPIRLAFHDMGGQVVELARLPMYMDSWMRRTKVGDINFVLYVASLADFNKPYNDQSTLLDEQIRMFKVVCDAKEFADCHVCLFLNKEDIFQRRSTAADEWLRKYYMEEFKSVKKRHKMHPHYDIGIDVILTLFRSAYHKTKRRDPDFFVRVTSAVDSKKMESIFGTVHHHVHMLTMNSRFDARP